MDKKRRALKILEILKKEYPTATTELRYKNPLQLLIATILSSQCTDERVNAVTKDLFKKYRTAEDFANSDIEELEEMIRSTGFYRNKARNIKSCCRMLVEEFNSEVPRTMDELTRLPGVARKTANIVLYHAYGINEGIAVDTHVRRLSIRLKLSKEKNPEKIERDLMKLIPRREWGIFSDILILHGRYVCRAKKPDCENCKINHLCPSAFNT
ncbi:MAG: endonuclease III [Candidatus Altiarchaeales archaeon]|nr:MAG: endonuclease III [Candidatus Altiarchaeales archaeon]RLI93536.1 MAG: endonuclease III [Candidatus Altiarchaeales archaeon]